MCQSAATWRINMYQIGNCACSAQKLNIILKVSDHLFCPFVDWLLIALENNSLLLNFYDVKWPRKVKLVTPMLLEPDISKTAGDRDSVPKYHQ